MRRTWGWLKWQLVRVAERMIGSRCIWCGEWERTNRCHLERVSGGGE